MKAGKKAALSGVILSVMTLTGCVENNTVKPVIAEPIVHQNTAEDPLESLKKLSIEARDELRLLAKAEQAAAQASLTEEQHKQKAFQALYVPKGFEQNVSLKFEGSAEDAARLIAEAAGYDFKVYGKKPLLSMFVGIHLDNQPLNDALKELGMQTGQTANVEVYESSRTIIMNYEI